MTKYKRVYRAVFRVGRLHAEAAARTGPRHQPTAIRSGSGPLLRDDIHAAMLALTPRLRRFGISLTGSIAGADQLIQHTCERALSQAAYSRAPARLDGWIYALMREVWADTSRAAGSRRHAGIESDPDACVPESGALAAVRHALGRLPAEQRSVLILVCVDGMSYQEAADILGLSQADAVDLLSQARSALSELLAAESLSHTGDVIEIASKFIRQGAER